MSLILCILLITALSVLFIIFLKGNWKSDISIATVSINALLSSLMAVNAMSGHPYNVILPGGPVFGNIPVRIDALSGWFILILNFTVFTGILYGKRYMKNYEEKSGNISLHYTSYIIIHLCMTGILIVQNSLAFLYIWEIMTLSAFILIIFEYHKPETLQSGINFLIQSHICILFLIIGFLWISSKTGSYDFISIGEYCKSAKSIGSLSVFLCFFTGFAIKSGFVPFHTWLPYAHPVAPAHISGIMSGVMIKLGIFGILRMLIIINQNYLVIGYLILAISLISCLYGVIMAIIQPNIKKLLAYSSIENIGIIGISIGLGSIGLGLKDPFLIFTGFTAALLHTLNHSLFKSLLFQLSGSIYQALHTLNIESMGGLIKKMPATAILFLISSLAICGLPPLNGFVSEFILYIGLFKGLFAGSITLTTIIIMSITVLTLAGGLAVLCFTKAFGIIFLGTERIKFGHDIKESEPLKLFPGFLIALFIAIIGVFPQIFIIMLKNPMNIISKGLFDDLSIFKVINTISYISILSCSFLIIIIIVLILKYLTVKNKENTISPVWGCGYVAPNRRMQYTSGSYVRSFRKLAQPLLMMNKKEDNITGMLSNPIYSQTNPYDKIESVFIDVPLRYINKAISYIRFIQNGNVRLYILYGVIFILLILFISFFSNLFYSFMSLLRNI